MATGQRQVGLSGAAEVRQSVNNCEPVIVNKIVSPGGCRSIKLVYVFLFGALKIID